MSSRLHFVSLAGVLALAGCVTVPTGPAVIALPGTAKSFDQFRADDVSCRQYAQYSLGPGAERVAADTAAANAAGGALLGAAAGAIIGSATGQAVGVARPIVIAIDGPDNRDHQLLAIGLALETLLPRLPAPHI